MAESIDIRALNELIERQSAFVTNLMTGMDQVIVGQRHLVESLLIGLLSDGHCCWKVCLAWPRPWLSRPLLSLSMPSSAVYSLRLTCCPPMSQER